MRTLNQNWVSSYISLLVLFTKLTFIEHQFCILHCARHREHRGEQECKVSALGKPMFCWQSLTKKKTNKQDNCKS